MHDNDIKSTLQHILGYNNDQQLDHYCTHVRLGVQMHLLIFWYEHVWYNTYYI